MRKRMVSVWAKRVLALTLSFAVITSIPIMNTNGVITEAYEYSTEVPEPVMDVTFESGFKGETAKNGLAVVESEPVLNYMSEQSLNENGGTDYVYDYTAPLYEGSPPAYKYGATANTPSSEYDEVMGHVIWMQADCTVDQFIKTKPADYVNSSTGESLTDINAVLDKSVPPYTGPVLDDSGNETEASLKAKEKATLQKEYTYYPEVKFNNPFANASFTETPSADATTGAPVWTKGATINYWIKLTADAENASASENTVVLNIKKSGSLQYPINVKVDTLWPTDENSKVPYGYADGFLQISADGSIVFMEDDTTTIDANANSDTHGQNVQLNTDNGFIVNGSDTILTDICKPDEWHMVTLQITNDAINTYYDGKLSTVELDALSGPAFNNCYGYKGTLTPELAIAEGYTKPSLLLDWLVSADSVSLGGCNEAFTNTIGHDANVTPFSLDDLTFYDELLTAEQITELYNKGAAKMAEIKTAELPEATIIKASELSTDVKSNTAKKDKVELPVLTDNARMGKVLKTFESKGGETSAAKSVKNPFAGKDLSGVTVSYWMKTASTEEATIGISFVDQKKPIYHPKMQDSYKNVEAFSSLYAKTNGFAAFQEGTSNGNVVGTLKNHYIQSVSDEKAAQLVADNADKWHLYTITVTNKEINYYIDGKKYENENLDKGPRFFDGYYQRMVDFADDNLIYGGSGNSGATSVLQFLAYEDTEMYVAFANTDKMEATYQVCQEAYFGDIICHEVALSDAQVAALYTQQVELYPDVPESTVELGDVNADTKINATDALAVLKHAAKIEELKDDALTAADVTKDAKADAMDALQILRYAAHIIDSF